MRPTATWHRAHVDDLGGMLRVQAAVHPRMQERPEVFVAKVRLCPQGCAALVRGDDLVGHGLAHFWALDDAPPLNTILDHAPPAADSLFLLDVALFLEGQGAGRAIVDRMAAVARHQGLSRLAPISVYGTVPLWTRYGFSLRSPPGMATTLAGYGGSARSMTAPVR